MGCVSSSLLDHEDDFTQLSGSRFGHHIVSLTSSTYGLLTIDPPSPHTAPTPPRFNLSSLFPTPEPKSLRSDPEVINSWELMADLDSESSRFPPSPLPKPPSSLLHTVAELDSRICKSPKLFSPSFKDNNKENLNSNPNSNRPTPLRTKPLGEKIWTKYDLENFERICPPGGENKVVIYTTTLRGVRRTFEACNAVRAAVEGVGVVVNERDVSMHNGYKEELRELMKGKEGGKSVVLPKVFVKGRYIGGVEEVLRINEEGYLGKLVEGLPRRRAGVVCDGCGGVGFLPCFECNGSCKLLEEKQGISVVIRCGECNENGLVLCPFCS